MKFTLTECLVVAVCFLHSANMAFCKSEYEMDNCFKENNKTWTCNYIPQSIPPGYSKIRIVNFRKDKSPVVLNSSTFSDTSWTDVKYLEMKDDRTDFSLYSLMKSNCFSGMKHLQELKIGVKRYNFDTDDTLAGIPTLKILDLRGSTNLPFDDVYKQFTKSGNLPQLQKLVMRGIGTYVSYETRLDFNFFHALGTRNITHLDIGGMRINYLNDSALLTELPTLKQVNLSYSHIEDITGSITSQEYTNRIQSMDISYVQFPSYFINVLPGKMVVSNRDIEITPDKYLLLKTFFAPEVMNITGIVKQVHTDTSLWFHNITFVFPKEDQSALLAKHQNDKRSLVFRENGLKYADIQVLSSGNSLNFESLISLDLSTNGLEMLHPAMLAVAPNLEIVNLSENEFGMMFSKLVDISSRLFANLANLRLINLSDNKIRFVPNDLFAENSKLEVIDLSKNRLEQIYFTLRNVHNLKVLNVSENCIHNLDEISLNNLNSIPCSFKKSHRASAGKAMVDFDLNPLACATCKAKQFVEWIIKTKSVTFSPEILFCKDKNEMLVQVDGHALTSVQNICRQPMLTTVLSVSAAVFVLIVIVSLFLIHNYIKKLKARLKRLKVFQKLRGGEGKYEFAVFVSFCSDDHRFVSENVLNPLNDNLKVITGVERNLVCTGDLGFRPGFHLHDEVVRCHQRSSVFIAVVSDNFCGSDFCQSEFDQAIVNKKPVLLMLKEHVDEMNMSPAMQDLFKRNARILWTEENGSYVVQPSWKDICVAILDRIELDT